MDHNTNATKMGDVQLVCPSASETEWRNFMRPFVDALVALHPTMADNIATTAHDQSGPTLADLVVYGPRVDTGARVNGMPIWCFSNNGVHVCEVEPGGNTLYRWAEDDPEPPL